MSFLRPEAKALLRRWAETAVLAVFAVTCLLIALNILERSTMMSAMTLLSGAVFLVAAINAGMRARVASRGDEQGVVLIDERRIGYFSPEGGGFVEMDHLNRLELAGGHWHLHQVEGPALAIPINAPNADRLLDLFGTLPGLSLARLHGILTGDVDTHSVVWSRAT